MGGSPDNIIMMAKVRQHDLLREAQRDRLAKLARATATANGDRRIDLGRRETSGSLLDRLIGRLKGAAAPAQPRTLSRDVTA